MAGLAKKVLVPVVIILAGIGGASVLMSGKQPPKQKPEETKDLLVEVLVAESKSHVYGIASQGMVQPKISSQLVAEVAGKIVAVSEAFVNGGFFSKGDVLIEIDSADHKTSVKAAEASLARAKASLAEEKARSEVAEKEWDSFMKGEAPELYLRKPQLARELANVQAAEADLERAKRELKRTKVVAPFNGIVKSKQADLGQFVNRGTMLGHLYGTDVAEVRMPVTDGDLNFLSFSTTYELQTQAPQVTLRAFAGGIEKQWQAKVVRSEGIIDESNRMTYLVAEVNDPYGLTQQKQAIEFGRFVHANIAGKRHDNLVVLPRDLVINGEKVLLVKDKQLLMQNVTVDRLDNQFAYISNGIEAEQQVVVTKVKNPVDGTPVRLLSDMTSSTAGEE